MSPLQEVVAIGLLSLLVYVIVQYYWLRVAACAAILALWALVSVIAPVYLAYDDLEHGRLFQAFFTLAISLVIAIPWFFGFDAARNWLKAEIKNNRWTHMPWNSK